MHIIMVFMHIINKTKPCSMHKQIHIIMHEIKTKLFASIIKIMTRLFNTYKINLSNCMHKYNHKQFMKLIKITNLEFSF